MSALRRIAEIAKRLYRDERGAAMTETVIMLPAFIIIWGCIYFVHKVGEQHTIATALARHCAWRHATDACPDDSTVDDICAIDEGDDIGDPWSGTSPMASIEQDVDFLGSLSGVITGKSITATREAKVKLPEVLGSEERTYYGEIALSCNERARGDIFMQMNSAAWGALTEGM